MTVGSGKQHKTVAAAVAAASNGDTIAVDAGVYANDYAEVIGKSLRFEAVGGWAVMHSSGNIANGKAIFITGQNNAASNDIKISFLGFHFVGAAVKDKNGAAIRHQNGHLVCTDCYFRHCQDGILGTPLVNGTTTIELTRCEFEECGAGDGQSHNMYMNKIEWLKLTDCYSHDARVGHLVKTRALKTTIVGCRLYTGSGTASYVIDFPNCGECRVVSSVLQQGAQSQNPNMMTFGVDAKANLNALKSCLVKDCVIVNEKPNATLFLNNSGERITVTENTIYGLTEARFGIGVDSVGNRYSATMLPLDTRHPWDMAGPEPPEAERPPTQQPDEGVPEQPIEPPGPEPELSLEDRVARLERAVFTDRD